MPELPEVEIVKNQLELILKNKKIIGTTQSNFRLRNIIPDLKQVINQTIFSIDRANKYLILTSEDFYIVIHLGMSGVLIAGKECFKKHIHYTLRLDNINIYYEDPRRFGLINIYSKKDFCHYYEIPIIKKLGVEPLSLDFSNNKLFKILQSKKSNIKKVLMDSNLICGIGNIYANEILFLSKLNPTIESNKITINQTRLLHKNIIEVLNKAIANGGSTISDFAHIDGSYGSMQMYYNVYNKKEQPCKVCSFSIEKIVQNGRSTFYCPSCQKI